MVSSSVRTQRDARCSLTDPGMRVTQLDLRNYLNRKNHDELRQVLSACDVIWVGGGNAFYLAWILRDTGAGQIISDLVRRGRVYAGGSAGSIIAGPTIHGFEAADDPSFAPALVLDGLSLTDVVVVPHWGRKDYGEIMKAASKALTADGYKTQPLTDAQALVIGGAKLRVISERKQTA